MNKHIMNQDAISKFAQSLRGPLIGRDHPEYDEARKLYNAMIDKRPYLIARCADAADVIAAVNFGRAGAIMDPGSGASMTVSLSIFR